MPKSLTHKQELFAQLVASGLNQSDAYRQAYNVSPDTNPATVRDNAYTLAHHTVVAPTIEALRDSIRSKMLGTQAWNLDRIVDEAATNLQLSREHKQLGSANGALELIGRATGLLSDKPREQLPQITRVVIVLDRGKDAEGRQRITEAAYEVLPLQAGEPVEDSEKLANQ